MRDVQNESGLSHSWEELNMGTEDSLENLHVADIRWDGGSSGLRSV